MSTEEQVAKDRSDQMIVGVFKFADETANAVDQLHAKGYGPEQVTIIAKEEALKRHFPDQLGEAQPDDWKKAATAGGSAGAILGGLLTATALATGAGIPIIIAGGMAGMLTGGVVGGLTGLMAERGFESDATDFFEMAVADGRFLVAVDLEEQQDSPRAKEDVRGAMQAAGAETISLDLA